MNKTKVAILLLLIIASAVRIFVIFNFDNKPGDSVSHVETAISILESPHYFHFDAGTSVLYDYSLAAILYFWRDPLFAPRFLNVIFGILIIIPFYFLVKMLFNERVAFYSNLILALYPLHTLQSGNTTSDIVYQFFFFSSLYYFFKFKQHKSSLGTLVLSAILFNIAALLRFESWTFIPLLSILLYKDGKKYSVLFLLLSLLLPSLWLYLCYHYTGDAFYSFTSSAKPAHAEILLRGVPYSKDIFGWIKVLSNNLGFTIVIFGLCGIIYAFFKKKSFQLALLFLLLFSLLTLNILLSRMWHNERYSIILGILILPYSMLFIERMAYFLRLKPVIVFLPFIILSLSEFKKISSSPRIYMPNIAITLPSEIKDIAVWLKKNVAPTDRIVLTSDPYDLFIPDIVIRSRISPQRVLKVYTPLNEPIFMTKERIMEYITTEKPRYLVLHSDNYLCNLFNIDMKQAKINQFGLIFELVYTKSIPDDLGCYNIYKIIYNN